MLSMIRPEGNSRMSAMTSPMYKGTGGIITRKSSASRFINPSEPDNGGELEIPQDLTSAECDNRRTTPVSAKEQMTRNGMAFHDSFQGGSHYHPANQFIQGSMSKKRVRPLSAHTTHIRVRIVL
jgi:hypothetical protein